MRPISAEEMKLIQLDIMDAIHHFCVEHNITYSLSYGTLLGAVRYGGYIPWDDDIDIVMPRPDYEWFLKEFNGADNNTPYRVIDHSNMPSYGLPFAKVHDTRTIMHETMYKQEEFGVYVDVFPLDGVQSKQQVKSLVLLNKFLNAKKATIDKQRSVIKNMVIAIGKLCLSLTDVSSLVSKINTLAKKVSFESSQKVGNLVAPYGVCEIVDNSLFSSYQLHKFEDKQYFIPVGYHEWLTSIYGDYMKLPPVEEQKTHHTYQVWWKNQ